MNEHNYSELLWSFRCLPNTYVVIDTETTGLFNDDAPGLVSVGVVKISESKTLIEKEFKVKPVKTISAEAESVHGISNSMAASFPEFPEVWPRISEIISGSLVVMHNASYDWRVLKSNSDRFGLAVPDIKGVFCSQKSAYPWAESVGIKVSTRGPSLDSLTVFFELEDLRAEAGFHGSLIDAKQTAAVVEALKRY